jgi:hypothetical protein
MILGLNGDYLLERNLLVMVKCGVLFEVRTDFLSIIKTSVGFKGGGLCKDSSSSEGIASNDNN